MWVSRGYVLCPADLGIDMIIDNDPVIERYISVPRDMSQLSCSSFTAGIVEAVLDGLGFVRLRVYFMLILVDLIQLPACSSNGSQHTRTRISVSNDHSYKTRKICT